ncbi:hypothetical protein ABZ479_39850 [Streptomyces sp. NPDC005722]
MSKHPSTGEHGHDLAASAAGRPARRRRLFVVAGITAALCAGGITAAAVVTSGARAEDGNRAMCAHTLTAGADLSEPPVEVTKDFDVQDATRTCAATWLQMWQGTPQPARFAACYLPNAQADRGVSSGSGAPVVYPADGFPTDEAACASIGSKPVVGD